jgi:hypothetical protein
MIEKSRTCRYCGEEFVPLPNKPGFVDECVECLVAKAMAAQPPRPSQLEELMAYIAEHPVTIDAQTGQPVRWKTRHELRQKLRRKGFDEPTIEKLVTAYMAVYVES